MRPKPLHHLHSSLSLSLWTELRNTISISLSLDRIGTKIFPISRRLSPIRRLPHRRSTVDIKLPLLPISRKSCCCLARKTLLSPLHRVVAAVRRCSVCRRETLRRCCLSGKTRCRCCQQRPLVSIRHPLPRFTPKQPRFPPNRHRAAPNNSETAPKRPEPNPQDKFSTPSYVLFHIFK